MIDFYTFGTPNGRKVSIALEEMGLDYETRSVDITKDEQFDPAFLAISPNNKIPAIFDRETGVSMMESGAILYYLATKTGDFLPKDAHHHWQAIEWLNWQMGGFGPMLGQAHHFLHFNPGKSDYAEQRFGQETRRLYGVLDRQLADRDYVAGTYSIADIAIWPWVSRYEFQKVDLTEFPNVLRWYRSIAERPAVIAGYSVPVAGDIPMPSDA